MKRPSYRAQDHAFGQRMLTLRTAVGLTQAGLAEILGVSRHAVSGWESGQSYPKADRLKQFIELGVRQGAFASEHAAEEIRDLWRAARQKVLLDEAWLQALLGEQALPPPAGASQHHPNNLPSQLSELYGRDEEIEAIVARLRDSHTRLLTLTGLGGIGKTRLALAAAAELLTDFRDGVFFVALDQIQDAAQVATALATTLGVREASDRPLDEALAQWLQPKRLLLVIDNGEHVLPAMSLVADLLRTAPDLTVLATSRVPLGIYGEQEHGVPPLSLPTPDAEVEALRQNAAVQLFLARAQAVASGFHLSAANAAAIADICTRLEGLPLAIELAAARVRVLPPAQILARLGDRLDFLATQNQDGPRRQQTLRATLEWSYALLAPPEQQLFAWLGVFVGGASLEAITAVTNAHLPQLDVVDGLSTLISHSLVQPPVGDSAPRYTLLETVREYARDQLALRGESTAAASEHITYFQQFVAVHDRDITGTLAPIAQEYSNLRTALREALNRRSIVQAIDLSNNLASFWYSSGSIREGWQFLQEVLALPLPPDASRDLQLQQAQLQQRAAVIRAEMGNHTQARQLVEAALTTTRLLDAHSLTAHCLADLSAYLDPVTDYDQCISLLNEALLLEQRLEHPAGVAMSYLRLGVVYHTRRSYTAAEEHYLAALTGYQALGRRRGESAALNNLGGLLTIQQKYGEAERYLAQALAISYDLDHQESILNNLLSLGALALYQTNVETAQFYLSEALQRADEGGYTTLAVFVVAHIGWLAELQGRAEQATHLLAAYETLAVAPHLGGSALTTDEEAPLHAARDRTRAQLGEAAFAHHYAAGQQMTLSEVIAVARGVVAPHNG